MVFNLANFAFGNTAQTAPSVHTYATSDPMTTVDTEGYFNSIIKQLKKSDIIHVYSTNGTPQMYSTWVWKHDGVNVNVTDGVSMGSVDTD